MRTSHFPLLPLPGPWAQALAQAGPQTIPPGQAMAKGGRDSMNARMQAHAAAIAATKIGLYFGDKSEFHGKTADERKKWIESKKTAGTSPPMPQESSCIGWAMEHVAAAYAAAGMGERWKAIRQEMVKNDYKGTVLAKELQKDGWEAVYFNPDVKHPLAGSGEHVVTARDAQAGRPYYGITVDHQVINYQSAGADKAELEKLAKVPFFFGIAVGGQHTFVGQDARVNELHWKANPDNPRAMEETALERFQWGSGVIMVPPGTWPK